MEVEKNIGIENLAFDNTEGIEVSKIEKVPHLELSENEFEDLPKPEFNFVQKWMEKIHEFFAKIFKSDEKFGPKLKGAKWLMLGVAFKIYFICAIIHYARSDSQSIEWCDGLGFLIILTVIVDISLIYHSIVKPTAKKVLLTKSGRKFTEKFKEKYEEITSKSWFSSVAILTVLSLIFIFLIVDTWNDQKRLLSFFGLIVFVLIAVIFSNNPARIR